MTSAKRGLPNNVRRRLSSGATTLCESFSYSANARMKRRITGTAVSVACRVSKRAMPCVDFPLSLYQGFIVPHQFDLTNQTFASWMSDFGKGLALNIVIGAPIAALALLGIRRVRRWWIVLWLGSIPLIILGVVITPLIID